MNKIRPRKSVFIGAAFFSVAFLCSPGTFAAKAAKAAKGSVSADLPMKPIRIGDRNTARLLISGKSENLDKRDKSIEKPLSISLWSVPNQGECVPETKTVCSSDFFLAVSELGDDPKQVVYFLGRFGDVTNVHWLPNSTAGTASLLMTGTQYPKDVLAANKELKQATAHFEVTVSIKKISAVKN